jgi:hypothetical protein
MTETIGQGLIVFGSLFLLDLIWARYTILVTTARRWSAGILASLIIALCGAAAISYVNDPWMLLPAMAGAFCGTVVGTKAE